MIERQSTDRRVVATTLIVWTLSFLFSLANYTFSDDHFGRISPGRQIARYGELPFRDFFDPGYFLTELSSAAMQRLFGDNLLGEMLLTSSFVAAGAVVIVLLVRRATGSLLLGMVAAATAVLAFGRPYDYDKFLFYPLGLLASWRYADTLSRRRLVAVAAVAVVAGLFRYDNGFFVVASGLTVLAVMHVREFTLLTRRVGLFLGTCLVGAVPYVLFLQLNGGIADAVSQMLTYGRRETARTDIGRLPQGALSDLRVTSLPPAPPDRVQVRWTPAADGERAALEARYTLHDAVERGDPQDRTWLYEVDDTSPANLGAIVKDPRVADTHLIDRARMTLMSQEPLATRLRRKVPFLGRSISWSASGAAAATFYLFIAVSLGAVAIALRSPGAPAERARVLSAAVVTLMAVALILRAPVVARIGGAIGPPTVLAAWMWHRYARRRFARVAVAVFAIATLAIATEWHSAAYRLERNGRRLGSMLSDAAMTPMPAAQLPKPHLAGLIDYLRRCTRPDDRVFAAWFVPELYFFSGRAFAGGMVVTFDGHWSERDRQERIVRKMAAESVPVAIFVRGSRTSFRESYGVVDDYLLSRFDEAGSSTFGERDGEYLTVLTRRDRVSTGIDPDYLMPCFA